MIHKEGRLGEKISPSTISRVAKTLDGGKELLSLMIYKVSKDGLDDLLNYFHLKDPQ